MAISTMWMQLTRITAGVLRCHTAAYLLRSVRRDVLQARRDSDQRHDTLRDHNTDTLPSIERAPSAEDSALAERLAGTFLDDAIESGEMTAEEAELVWLCAVHRHGVPTAARQTGTPIATAYRMRTRAHESLRHVLAEAS